jgi:hypothetical protein
LFAVELGLHVEVQLKRRGGFAGADRRALGGGSTSTAAVEASAEDAAASGELFKPEYVIQAMTTTASWGRRLD